MSVSVNVMYYFEGLFRLVKQLYCSFFKVPNEKDGKSNVADHSNVKSYQPNGLLGRALDSFRPVPELPVEDFTMLK
jgi:hypothetical protein